jgi:hypothetical protein
MLFMVRPFAEQQKSQTKYSSSVCYEKRMSRKSFKLLQKLSVLGSSSYCRHCFDLRQIN